MSSQPALPPSRWMPPCGGCWSGTEALSPLTRWRCSRAKNSSLPSRRVLTWMLVCPPIPRGLGGDAGVYSPGSPLSPPHPPDRPDCVQGRVCFVFYSHLKNMKEVYVTTTLDRQAQAVRGQVGQLGRVPPAAQAEARTLSPTSSQPQVSFYRGAAPEEVPEEAEAARHRKGTDSPWMATLPIKLPVWPGVGGSACEGGRGGTEARRGEAGGEGRGQGSLHPFLPTETAGIQGARAGAGD